MEPRPVRNPTGSFQDVPKGSGSRASHRSSLGSGGNFPPPVPSANVFMDGASVTCATMEPGGCDSFVKRRPSDVFLIPRKRSWDYENSRGEDSMDSDGEPSRRCGTVLIDKDHVSSGSPSSVFTRKQGLLGLLSSKIEENPTFSRPDKKIVAGFLEHLIGIFQQNVPVNGSPIETSSYVLGGDPPTSVDKSVPNELSTAETEPEYRGPYYDLSESWWTVPDPNVHGARVCGEIANSDIDPGVQENSTTVIFPKEMHSHPVDTHEFEMEGEKSLTAHRYPCRNLPDESLLDSPVPIPCRPESAEKESVPSPARVLVNLPPKGNPAARSDTVVSPVSFRKDYRKPKITVLSAQMTSSAELDLALEKLQDISLEELERLIALTRAFFEGADDARLASAELDAHSNADSSEFESESEENPEVSVDRLLKMTDESFKNAAGKKAQDVAKANGMELDGPNKKPEEIRTDLDSDIEKVLEECDTGEKGESDGETSDGDTYSGDGASVGSHRICSKDASPSFQQLQADSENKSFPATSDSETDSSDSAHNEESKMFLPTVLNEQFGRSPISSDYAGMDEDVDSSQDAQISDDAEFEDEMSLWVSTDEEVQETTPEKMTNSTDPFSTGCNISYQDWLNRMKDIGCESPQPVKASSTKRSPSKRWTRPAESGVFAQQLPLDLRCKIQKGNDADVDNSFADLGTQRKKMEPSTSDSDSEDFSSIIISSKPKASQNVRVPDVKKLSRKLLVKRARRIWTDKEVSARTRRAVKEEAARKSRISQLPEFPENILDKFSEVELGIIDRQIEVDKGLWDLLLPHQKDGVRFLYRCVVESYERYKHFPFGGCVLAHSMGLGKTIQVISFLQALLACQEINVKTAVVICPSGIVLNWNHECEHWMKNVADTNKFKAYPITSDKKARAEALRKWSEGGGVLIISYKTYTSMCSPKLNKDQSPDEKAMLLKILQDPGPDIVICDEAHELRNATINANKVVGKIATLGRIALTGTPMQNNLDEYYEMINFIKPDLLGSQKEFKNRFKDPIDAGSSEDSASRLVRIMKQRSHILRETLSECLSLKSVAILQESLPAKTEHIIKVRPSPLQVELYKAFIQSPDSSKHRFAAMKIIQLFCFHPRCLHFKEEDLRKKHAEAVKTSGATGDAASWFENILPPLNDTKGVDVMLGPKVAILREIILGSMAKNDKVLIFAERLGILSCVEEVLLQMDAENLKLPDGRDVRLAGGRNYLVLSGEMKMESRLRLTKNFNNSPECHVFLLSIHASQMGINLIGANRVILVEPMWSPTIDRQALSCAYRYGQTKPVYVYRLVTVGIPEERAYDLQIKKQLLSNRGLEATHGVRTKAFSSADLFKYTEHKYDPRKPFVPLAPPEDAILGHLLSKFPEYIVRTDNFDSLMEETEPALSPEESITAWAEYETENNSDGNPFTNLQADLTLFKSHLNKSKSCNFTVKEAHLASLQTFTAAVAKHIPKNVKKEAKAGYFLEKFRIAMAGVRTAAIELRPPAPAPQTNGHSPSTGMPGVDKIGPTKISLPNQDHRQRKIVPRPTVATATSGSAAQQPGSGEERCILGE